jgi:hypothetical protein
VVPAVNLATTQAVEASMKGAFAEIAAPARTALEQAVKPVIEQFLGLAKRTQQMEANGTSGHDLVLVQMDRVDGRRLYRDECDGLGVGVVAAPTGQ